MPILKKECPQCKEGFSTDCDWDVYCSRHCKEVAKNMRYLQKWANTVPKKKKVQDHQRLGQPQSHKSYMDSL